MESRSRSDRIGGKLEGLHGFSVTHTENLFLNEPYDLSRMREFLQGGTPILDLAGFAAQRCVRFIVKMMQWDVFL